MSPNMATGTSNATSEFGPEDLAEPSVDDQSAPPAKVIQIDTTQAISDDTGSDTNLADVLGTPSADPPNGIFFSFSNHQK